MKHELKIWPQYYQAVADGSKTFEVRKNDRGFRFGDTVILKEYDPGYEEWCSDHDLLPPYKVQGRYTGRISEFKIGYVLPIDSERVVFSLLPPEGQDKKEG